MAVAYGNWMSPQSGAELVLAQPGKIIRVRMLVVSSWGNVKITPVSNPGASAVDLTAPIHLGEGHALVVRLGRDLALATGRGEAFGVETVFDLMGAASHSVTVWYELVS